MLIIAINLGYKIKQYDVKNAFVHAKIDTEIYIELPDLGPYTNKNYKNKVGKLVKAIYGLKQSPRLWY